MSQKYTNEFKLEAVKLVIENAYTLRQAGDSLGAPKTLSKWKIELQKGNLNGSKEQEELS